LEVKVLYRPTGGTVSRTARVSIARWNLKEAAGKALVLQTEIAYKAVMPDEKAYIFKVPYLSGRHGRKCGGHKREVGCANQGKFKRKWVSSGYEVFDIPA
jgi:hypothetical protein